MKNTKKIKIILDVILTVTLLTLFSKNFFGIQYHEVMGLAVLIPILIHIFLNLKMIWGMCKNFGKVPWNIKICLIVDILLFLIFAWLGISGILISKTIFTGISTENNFVKLYHICLGGISVILLGIHIGLHICRKEMKKWIAVLLTIFSFAAAIYGFTNSDLIRWVSMPFMASSGVPVPSQGEHLSPGEGNEGGAIEKSHLNEAGQQGQGFGQGKGQGYGKGKGMGKGEHRGQSGMSILNKISVFIQFLGIMFSFAMIVYWIVIGKKKLVLHQLK